MVCKTFTYRFDSGPRLQINPNQFCDLQQAVVVYRNCVGGLQRARSLPSLERGERWSQLSVVRD